MRAYILRGSNRMEISLTPYKCTKAKKKHIFKRLFRGDLLEIRDSPIMKQITPLRQIISTSVSLFQINSLVFVLIFNN